jgi:hypothetical protein
MSALPVQSGPVRVSGGVARHESQPSSLVRRVSAAMLARRAGGGVGSFTVADSGGRVRVAVRVDGRGGVRVVAVCAPGVRERVERALAHARFVLAGNGRRVEGSS